MIEHYYQLIEHYLRPPQLLHLLMRCIYFVTSLVAFMPVVRWWVQFEEVISQKKSRITYNDTWDDAA